MKLLVFTAAAIFSTMAFADIIVKSDGTIICEGRCDGIITQPGSGGGTYTICQGNNCVTISTGGLGGTKFPEKRPGDEK